MPALGSDLGKLNWADVKARIDDALGKMAGVDVVVFEPGSVPADGRPNRSADAPKMTPARAVLVSLMRRYLAGGLDPFVTLLEVHKLMYFMQESGEPLRLNFSEGDYGPYAENLRHLLRSVEGHLIYGYKDGGDDPYKELNITPGALKDAEAFLDGLPDVKRRLGRVADLVDGFETPFGLELLSTVHWVAVSYPSAGEDEIIERIYGWNRRKRQFSERQIGIALRTLADKGWLKAPPKRVKTPPAPSPSARDGEKQLGFSAGWGDAGG